MANNNQAIRQAFVVVGLLFGNCHRSHCSWSRASISHYDDVRLVPSESNVFDFNISDASNVIEVQEGISTLRSRYRICHLTSMLAKKRQGRGAGEEEEESFLQVRRLSIEAAGLLAMLHFNSVLDNNDVMVHEIINSNSTIPKDCNVRLTMELYDTKFSPIEANRILIEDILTRNHSLTTPRPCAIVGATLSSVSASLSIMSSVRSIPMISALSTSSILDNKDIYNLFGRTVPSDRAYAVAAVTYLHDVLKVTHCGVLYVRDEWGRSFNNDFTQAKEELYQKEMSIRTVPVNEDARTESIEQAIAQLKATGYNYFFGIILQTQYEKVIRIAYREGLVGPETKGDIANATNGIGVLALNVGTNRKFDEAWKTLESDPILKDFFMSKQPNNSVPSNFVFKSKPNHREYYQYDAVMALGIAMCRAEKDFFDGAELFDSLIDTSFEGASGSVSFDSDTGARALSGGAFKVMNVILNPSPENGYISFKSTEVARETIAKNGIAKEAVTTKFWEIVALTYFADGSTKPPDILPPLVGNENKIDTFVIAVVLSFTAAVMCMSLAWAAWTIVNRRTSRVVQFSQPRFLCMLCAGTFIMPSSIIPRSLQEPMGTASLNIACVAAPWLFQIGFVVTYSALLCKTERAKVFFSPSRGFRRSKGNVMKVFFPFLVLFVLTIILLSLWTLLAPDRWQRSPKGISKDQYGRFIESYGRCDPHVDSDGSIFFILIGVLDICVLLLYQNFQARDIPSKYSDADYINWCMGSTMQIFVIGIPVLTVVAQNPAATYVVESFVVTFASTVTLLCLFIPKELARRQEVVIDNNEGSKSTSVVTEQRPWSDLKRDHQLCDGGERRHGSMGESEIFYPQSDSFDSGNFDHIWSPRLDGLAL